MKNLYKYTPGRDTDLLFAQLWVKLDAEGDLDKLFGNVAFPLGDYFVALRPPREVLYAVDEEGIWLTVTFEPMMSGAYLSAYVRPDRRSTIAAGSMFLHCLRAGVEAYGTLINVTWQEELIPIHEAIGYNFVGRVPGLFNGREALIFTCSADSLSRRKAWRNSLQLLDRQAQQPAGQVPAQAQDFRALPLQALSPRLPQQPEAGQPALPALVLAVLQARAG